MTRQAKLVSTIALAPTAIFLIELADENGTTRWHIQVPWYRDFEANAAKEKLESAIEYYSRAKSFDEWIFTCEIGSAILVQRGDQRDEISRADLLKLCGITSQALNARIKNQGHPKPCRTSGKKKQWFSMDEVQAWERRNS